MQSPQKWWVLVFCTMFLLTFSKEVAASNQIYRFHYQFSTGETQQMRDFFTNFDGASWGPAFEDQAHGTHHEKGSTNQYGLSFRFQRGKGDFKWERIHWRMYIGCFHKIGGKPKWAYYSTWIIYLGNLQYVLNLNSGDFRGIPLSNQSKLNHILGWHLKIWVPDVWNPGDSELGFSKPIYVLGSILLFRGWKFGRKKNINNLAKLYTPQN